MPMEMRELALSRGPPPMKLIALTAPGRFPTLVYDRGRRWSRLRVRALYLGPADAHPIAATVSGANG